MAPLLTGFPFSAGGATPKATVTGTTGSPTVDTTSRPGKTIYLFNASGSITVGVAGTCEILVVGGGGAGGGTTSTTAPGGGAGGVLYNTEAYLSAGTLTVTVGGGATGGGSNGYTYAGFPSEMMIGYVATNQSMSAHQAHGFGRSVAYDTELLHVGMVSHLAVG